MGVRQMDLSLDKSSNLPSETLGRQTEVKHE